MLESLEECAEECPLIYPLTFCTTDSQYCLQQFCGERWPFAEAMFYHRILALFLCNFALFEARTPVIIGK